MDDALIPVSRADIALGKPLAWPLYDAHGVLLLDKGVVVGSETELQALIDKGLFREAASRLAASTDPDVAAGERQQADLDDGSLVTMDRIRLTPGDLVQLRPLQDGITDRYNVHYLGMFRGRSVMVSTPVVEDKVVFVREGQLFLVRAFAGLDVCGFKAQVLASHMRPYPYLHLKYPPRVQVQRVRRALRAATDIITAVYESEGGRLIGSGRIVDLSAGGARISSPGALADRGGRIHVAFRIVLNDVEELVSSPAIVRSVAQEADAKGQPVHMTGVEFDGMASYQRLVVMNLVYRLLYKEA